MNWIGRDARGGFIVSLTHVAVAALYDAMAARKPPITATERRCKYGLRGDVVFDDEEVGRVALDDGVED
mgnify:CR=1 FL=1